MYVHRDGDGGGGVVVVAAAAGLYKYMYTATDVVISAQGSEALPESLHYLIDSEAASSEAAMLAEDALGFVDVAIATVDLDADEKEEAIRRLLEKLGADWEVDAPMGVWWDKVNSFVRLRYIGEPVADLKQRNEDGAFLTMTKTMGHVDVAISTVDLVLDAAKAEAIRHLSKKLGTDWEVDKTKGVWWNKVNSLVRSWYVGDDTVAVAALKQRSVKGEFLTMGSVEVLISGFDFVDDAKAEAIRRLLEKLGANSELNWEVDKTNGVWWDESNAWVKLWYVGDDAGAVADLKLRITQSDALFVGYVDFEILSARAESKDEAITRLSEKLGTDWEVEESAYVQGAFSKTGRVWYCGDPSKADASTAVADLRNRRNEFEDIFVIL